MDWSQVIPAFLSAIAAVAAAIAAFKSLQISKQTAATAKEAALATYHNSAVIALTDAVKTLKTSQKTTNFFEAAYGVCSYWASDIEHQYTIPNTGGNNPRPLRHVLYDGAKTLAHYGMEKNKNSGSIYQSILSVISNGMGEMTEEEYEKLLKKADGDHFGPDSIFGKPSPSFGVKNSTSFRWTCYQLLKRIHAENWTNIWEEAWQEMGRIKIYQKKYLEIKPVFEKTYQTLKSEKDRLAHSLFPLSVNPDLDRKYNQLLFILEVLIEDCSFEPLEIYKKWEFEKENSHLVLIAMAISALSMIHIDKIGEFDC